MEFLKELLGEELYAQVASKLGDKVKLVDLKSGNYVGKEKYEAAEQAKRQLEADIAQRDKDLEGLKKAADGNAELQKRFDELKREYDSGKAAYEAKLRDLEIATALKLELNGKAHDVDLVAGLIQKDKIELADDGTIKSGIKEQLEDLRKSKSFLFVNNEPQPPKLGGVIPADGVSTPQSGAGSGGQDSIGARLGKMNVGAIKNDNPYFKKGE